MQGKVASLLAPIYTALSFLGWKEGDSTVFRVVWNVFVTKDCLAGEGGRCVGLMADLTLDK